MTENEMTLLRDFEEGVHDPTGWIASEKYRGCRGYWDGAQLWTRGGNVIPAPAWFTERLPKGVHLDGEIHAGRCEVETKARLAVQYGGKHWTEQIRFAVFDAPETDGVWEERISAACRLPTGGVLHVVRTLRVEGLRHLRRLLWEIVQQRGEGLVLRHPTYKGYVRGRTDTALRVTPSTLFIH
jgi:DNA ligase 1